MTTDYEQTQRQPQPYEVLARMKNEGATQVQLVDYINQHPDAMRGAEASRIVNALIGGMTTAQQIDFINKHPGVVTSGYSTTYTTPGQKKIVENIQAQLKEYGQLKDEAQFNKAVELGFVPAGSKYVAGVAPASPEVLAFMEESGAGPKAIEVARKGAQAGYYAPEQVKQIKEAIQAGKQQARQFIELAEERKKVMGGYKSGAGYDLVAAIQGGVKPTKLKELGFAPLNIVDAQRQVSIIGAQKIILGKLADYKVGSGYDLAAAMSAGVAESELRTIGYAQTDIDEAKRVLDARDQLKGYKVKPYSEATMYEAVKAGKFTVPEIVAKRESEFATSPHYETIQYLRDNPGEIKLLVTIGYDETEIKKLDTAIQAADKYWTADNKLRVYDAYVGGVNPEYLSILTGQSEQDIKGLRPPMQEFYHLYLQESPPIISGKPSTVLLTPAEYLSLPQKADRKAYEQWYIDANKKYREMYGSTATAQAAAIEFATGIFLPAKMLEPTVKFRDVRGWEWIVGGVQVAMYTSPIWLPRVINLLKPLSKLELLAREAGNSRLKVNIARGEMLSRSMTDSDYALFASNLQKEIQASMRADKLFLNQLTALNKISPRQLVSIEKLSGIRDLANSIKEVGQARLAVIRSWDILDKGKYYANPTSEAQILANQKYLSNLQSLQINQNSLSVALAKASGKLTPVYQLSPSATWANVINNTEKEIRQLQSELTKAESAMKKAALPSVKAEAHEYWLGIKDQLANAQNRLKGYNVASAAGDVPPDIARYMLIPKTPTQAGIESFNKMMKEIDDWNKGLGKYKPEVSPESVVGKSSIATAVRPELKIAIPQPTPEIMATYAEAAEQAAAKVPGVAKPATQVSVFPGLATPKVKITTKTKTTTAPAVHIGAMTPEQAHRLYGSEIRVNAYSPHRIQAPIGKPSEWLSPARAIQAAEQIAVNSYTEQVAKAVIQEVTQLKVSNATLAEIRDSTDEMIRDMTEAITNPQVRAQVQQAVRVRVRMATTTITTPPTSSPTSATPFIPLGGGKETEEEKRERIKRTRGAVTYKMGKLGRGKNKKDVWWTKMPSGEVIVVLGKPPLGARILAEGPGSAYKTAQRISKGTFSPYEQQHGAVRARISPAPTAKGAEIRFSPKRRSSTNSVRIGRQYFTNIGGSIAVSRRPLKRRRRGR